MNPALMMMYQNRSGEKRITKYLDRMLGDSDAYTNAQLTQLAAMLSAMYGQKWNKTYTALTTAYEPLDNYAMVEEGKDTRTPNLTSETTRTPDLTKTDKRTPNLTTEDKRTPNLTTTDTRTPNLSEATTYGKTDTQSFTNRHDVTTTTPELTKTVYGNDGYQEQEKSTVAGQTTTHTVKQDNTDHTVSGFNSTTMVPSESSKRTGSSSDQVTAGTPGDRTLTVTGNKTEERQRVTGGDGVSDTEYQGSESKTLSGTDTMKTTGSDTTEKTETGTDTSTRKETGTDTTESKESGTETVNRHDSGTDVTAHNLTRHGNIGVTTSQDMLRQELEVRKYLFFEQLFADMDELFTIPVYF